MARKRKKQTIFKMFLIPVTVLLLAQSLLTMGILVFQRVTVALKDSSVNMMVRMVENRSVILQNDMTDRWTAVSGQESSMNLLLEEFMTKKNVNLSEILSSKELENELLAEMFPDCMSLLENNLTTGIFLIMTGDDPSVAGEYTGFFLRDSNPLVSPINYSDLLMERGSKELSRTFNVPLDTYWTTSFQMPAEGTRMEDDYFYQPWLAAMEYPQADISDLGYWAAPFILGADEKDSHEMITYSVPLRYQGTVYAVLGVELSVEYLYDYIPVDGLNSKGRAGYAIALQNEDGSYTPLFGTGVLYYLIK
jgi:hypothetical protein